MQPSNPYDVLTNNPPFNYHSENVKNYLSLTNKDSVNKLNQKLDLKPYSNGMGAMFLPGDYSSSSRFIKTFFIKSNLDLRNDETFNVVQFFNTLSSVKMVLGCVKTKIGDEYTRYMNCYNLDERTMYYQSYFSSETTKVTMSKFNLDDNKLTSRNFHFV